MKIVTRILGIGMVAAILTAPSLFSQPQDPQAGAEGSAPAEIRIIATDYKFDPPAFTVKAGQKVRVTLVNQGKKDHNIQFDLPGGKTAKITEDVRPGQTGTVEFTAGGPGTFTFTCPVGIHSSLGMQGKMIVQ